MKVVCVGDSNTYGYDPRSCFGGRYPKENRWVDLLAARTGWRVCNQGENGQTLSGATAVVPADTDLLIVMLGTNDLLQGYTPENVARKMKHFLLKLPFEREKLLLVAPPPMARGEWVPDQTLVERSQELSREYQRVARELNISFADAGAWKIPLCYDGVHFTEQGHRAFAAGLLEHLAPLGKERR